MAGHALAEVELPVVCVETRHMQAVLKAQINRSVPVRPANVEFRTGEYLTKAEVAKLIKEARQGRSDCLPAWPPGR